MKSFTKTLIVPVIVLVMLAAGAAVVKAGSDEDLGVTVVCSGDICVATSKFNGATFTYQKNDSKIGPFPKSGEIRLYFQILAGASMNGQIQVKLTNGSQIKTLIIDDSEEIIDTGLQVSQGNYVYVEAVDADGDGVGWHNPISEKCGSGFTLPRTRGARTGYYPIIDVSSEIDWARQAGEPVVQDMCWADWPEWAGDYDFEDYFIALSYVTGGTVLPTVDLKVNGSDATIYLQEPADYTLSWASTNADSCSVSNAWSGSRSTSGSEFVNDKPDGSYTYTITCTGAGGSASDTVTVIVTPQQLQPTVDLKVNGSDGTVYLTEPADYTLSWTSQNADSCYASSGFWSGTRPTYGSEYVYDRPQGTYNYSLTCSNGYGSASDTVHVAVNPAAVPYSYIYLQKTSREVNATSTAFIEDLYTYPGRQVEFSLAVTLSGSGSLQNVTVRDILPDGLTYVSGSTTIDGLPAADGLVGFGINLGSMYSGQTKTVKFRALVRENSYFSQSVVRLANTAVVDADNGKTATDATNIWVVKTGQVLGATDIDTGPEEILMAGGYSSIISLLMAGFQTGRRAYWKRQIRLARVK
jgi:uncharacterized repeat protein (TIGR01451 family)